MQKSVGQLQIVAGLLFLICGFSFPLAYAANRFLDVRFFTAFAAVSLTSTFALLVALRNFHARESHVSGANDSPPEVIDVSEAKTRAHALISDPSKFLVVQDPAKDFPFADSLAPHVREFFKEFRLLEATRGDALLERQTIARSQLNSSYIRIGADIESVEIAVRAGDETIYEIDSFDPDTPFDRHPSIYHWIIATAKTLYEE